MKKKNTLYILYFFILQMRLCYFNILEIIFGCRMIYLEVGSDDDG